MPSDGKTRLCAMKDQEWRLHWRKLPRQGRKEDGRPPLQCSPTTKEEHGVEVEILSARMEAQGVGRESREAHQGVRDGKRPYSKRRFGALTMRFAFAVPGAAAAMASEVARCCRHAARTEGRVTGSFVADAAFLRATEAAEEVADLGYQDNDCWWEMPVFGVGSFRPFLFKYTPSHLRQTLRHFLIENFTLAKVNVSRLISELRESMHHFIFHSWARGVGRLKQRNSISGLE